MSRPGEDEESRHIESEAITVRKLSLWSVPAALVFGMLLGGNVGARADQVLWYNGDFDNINGLSNEQNTSISQANVYDDFIIAGTTWDIHTVWSNNLMDFAATSAYWEIRSGVSAGNGGTLIASGTDAATETATGRSGFGDSEYTISVTGLNVVLGPGTYWLTVSPIDDGSGRSFVSTTSGANAIGNPPGNDDNSYFNSSFYGTNFAPAAGNVGLATADFSMGVAGTYGSAVPEPSAVVLLASGVGLISLARFRRGRRDA